MKVEYNINDIIKVKLTELGLEKHKEHWLQFIPEDEYDTVMKPNIIPDASGYSEFQMLDFMQIYGPFMYNGCKPVCEMKILLVNANPINND